MFAKIFQQLIFWPTFFLLKLFFDYRIEGAENLKGLEDKAVIFASNHGSYIDAPVCAIALPWKNFYTSRFFPIRFLAHEKYCDWKTSSLPFPISVFGAAYIKLNGSIKVKEGLGDLNIALCEPIIFLKKNGKIWIHPEGQISPDGKLGRGKRGIAFLYKETGAVIVPVGLVNNYKLHTFNKFFSRPTVIVRFGKPIYSFKNPEALEENVDEIMKEIDNLINFNGNQQNFFEDNFTILKLLKEKKLFPDIYKINGTPTSPEVNVINDKGVISKVLMFSSNNYLGLANDNRVKSAVIKGVEKYGMGSGGSRLVSGNTEIQVELESSIAKLKGCDSAITFSTGYMANTGVIPAFLNPPKFFPTEIAKSWILKKIFRKYDSTVFSDEFNHASIVDGCRLARSNRVIYKHKNLDDLEYKLKKNKYGRKLIITDGIFSMDGDISPVKDLVFLSRKYGAALMIDDAHGTGVLGENGGGTSDYFQLKEKPEIIMGTCTKALGGVGGFVAGSKDIIEYLRISARTYIFSAPIPPAISAGLMESIKIINEEKPFKKLKTNIEYFLPLLRSAGFNILETETQIIPLIIGDDIKTIEVSRKLFKEGILVPAIRWPAVPKNLGRLRITLMATHSKENLDYFLGKLKKVKQEIKF